MFGENNNIAKIINDVKARGDKAVAEYTLKFDRVNIYPEDFLLSQQELDTAVDKIDTNLKHAINHAAENIEFFHKCERNKITKSWKYSNKGKTVGQIVKPVETICVYIAGGKYAYYPSIVLMTVIPARIAGVKNIYIATPPANITPSVLYAAKAAKVDKVFRVGGPQAIAGFAFGTEALPKADMIIGPGSSYVTEAKRQLFGNVGIDLIAGPSEVALICDSSSNPVYIAYDLLAQIEHAPDAKGYLYCDSKRVIEKVKKLIEKEIKKNKEDIPHLSVKRQIIMDCCSLQQSIDKVNTIAPEHLQIMHREAKNIVSKIKNAGAVFIGKYSPVAAGDYYAGPSHTLPTAGTARFSSGLSVQTFMKKTSYIEYNNSALKRDSKDIIQLAYTEGLRMHGKSVKVRT